MSIEKFEKLTDEVKAICAAWFGMLEPNKGVLRFGMKAVRPSKRAQDALDTLASVGIVKRIDEVDGGVQYVPTIDCSDLLPWFEANHDRQDFVGALVEKTDPNADTTMVITMSADGDPRVVVMHSFMNDIMKLTREQHQQFLLLLDNWGYFKPKKKDDALYRDQLRSMISKSLKKTREISSKEAGK